MHLWLHALAMLINNPIIFYLTNSDIMLLSLHIYGYLKYR